MSWQETMLNSSHSPMDLNSTANNSGLVIHALDIVTPSPDEETVFIGEPVFSRNVRFSLYAVIFFLAIAGNCLVCYITFRNRRMWTFSYSLITNLALSEIGTVLCLPYFLVVESEANWIFGDVMCRLVSPSIFMFNIVTTNTMVAIACDRYRAVVYPFKFRPSTSETRLVIALIWLIAFLFALPSFGSLELISYPDVPGKYQCIEVFSSDEEDNLYYTKIYSMTLFVLNCLIPIVFIVLLYVKIAATLMRVTMIPPSLRPNSLHLTPNNSPRNSAHVLTMSAASAKARYETERKFLKMLLVIVLVFFSCYVPYQILYLVYEFHPDLAFREYMHTLAPYIYMVTWLPNAINPICYGSLNSYYARAFKLILCGTRKYAMIAIRKTSNASANLRNVIPPAN